MRKGGLWGVWYDTLGKAAKGDVFLIHLQRNALSVYLKGKSRYPLEHWAELVLGHLAHFRVPHREIRMQGPIVRTPLIIRRPSSNKMEDTDGK